MRKETGLIQGIAAALILSLAAASLIIIGYGIITFKFLIAALSYGYIIYTLSRSRTKAGSSTVLTLSAAIFVILILTGVTAGTTVLLSVTLIWAVRSLYSYSGIFSSLIDAALCFIGIGSAFWTYVLSGSLIASVWSFFLVQALSVFIPENITKSGKKGEANTGRIQPDPFGSAYDVARDALKQIIQQA